MRAYILLTIALLILLPFASSQIVLPQFKEVYSTGDIIDANFEIMESQDLINEPIKLELNCGEKTLIYTNSISLKANNWEKTTEVNPYLLLREGACIVDATLDGSVADSASSKSFIISNDLNISLKLNKESFKPGDMLRIKGDVKKANGNYIDGTASIKMGNEGYSEIAKKGAFEFETTLKENFPSGDNEIIVEVKDNSGNAGSESKTINVAAIPTSIEIVANKDKFMPGDKLETSAVLYDQSGKEMDKEMGLTLYNSWGLDVEKKVLNGSEKFEYEFTTESPTGEWWIYAYSEGIKTRKFIAVEEQSKIDVILNSSILKILNEGNIVFKKPVEIIFNGQTSESKIEELSLGVGEEKEIELNAPDGEYDITVKSEDFEKTFENVWLTGKAIELGAPGGATARTIRNIIALAIIIAFAALAVFLKIKRERNKPIKVGKSFNTSTKKFREKL
jgi:hypothetical protein